MKKYRNIIFTFFIIVFIGLNLISCSYDDINEQDQIYIESFDYEINRNKSTVANELSYSLSFDIDFSLNHKFNVYFLVVRIATVEEAIENNKSFHFGIDYSNTEDIIFSSAKEEYPYLLFKYTIVDVTTLNANAQIKITSKDLIDDINNFIKIDCYCESKEVVDKNNILNNKKFKMDYSDDSLIHYEFDEFSEAYTVVSVVNRFDSLEVPATYKGYPVKIIGEGAFYGCSDLKHITIPDSVTRIEEEEAFKGCSSLTSITLPFVGASPNDTEKNFLGYLFGAGSYSDNSLYVPKSLKEVTLTRETYIGENTFQDCNNLTNITILGAVTSISDYAFSNCSSLESINLPNSIENIGEYTFEECPNLVYNEYDNAYYLGNKENPYLVLMKAKTTDITSCKIANNTKIIYNSAFSNCKLTNIEIPNSVISIGKSVFSNCDNLQYNEYDNACYLGNEENPYLVLVKAQSTEITTCEIHSNTRIIYSETFSHCNSLISITIPESITSIGIDVFLGCSRLVEIYNLSSIDMIEGTGNSAKIIHTSLEEESILITKDDYLFFKDNENRYYLFYYYGTATDLVLPNEIEGNHYEIYVGAFSGFSNIKSITIPDSVTSIGYNAFYQCNSLESITLPFVGGSLNGTANPYFGYIFGAKSPSDHENCVPESLKEVIITGGTSIGENAFSGCHHLTSITLAKGVTSIGNFAFSGCSNIKNITLLEGVKRIGKYAFKDCSSLENISLPNSLERIGESAFSSCDNLQYYEYDNGFYLGNEENPYLVLIKVKSTDISNCEIHSKTKIIDDFVFYDCGKLTNITLPNSLESIGENAFAHCNGLTSIVLPNGVKWLGKRAFFNCVNIERISIPSSIESIGEDAFNYCYKLVYNEYDNGYYLGNEQNPYVVLIEAKSLDISNCIINSKTKMIYRLAFSYCNYLTSIIIPDSIESIGDWSFYGSDKLNEVFYMGTSKDWNLIVIEDANSELTSATIYYYSETKPIEDGNYWHYVDGIATKW